MECILTAVRVDPLDFSQAADNFHAVGVNIVARLSATQGRLNQYARMAGDDTAGSAFAGEYDAAAASILAAVDRLATQANNFDRALAASGILHASAEAGASLNTAPGASFGLRPERPEVCPAPPASALGGDPNDPPAWVLIKDAVGLILPNGDPDQLRGAARAWNDIAKDLDDVAIEISRADNALSGTQSAELDAIRTATGRFATDARGLAEASRDIADATEGFAGDIEEMRAEVLRTVAQLAIEVAASIGIGVALSFVTFGAAGAAAGGLIAARIVMVATRIVELITSTGGAAVRIAARIAAAHARLLAIIRGLGTGTQAWIRVGIDITAGTSGALIAEGTIRGDQANYLAAGVGGFFGGAATAGILAGFARRANTLLANVLAGAGGGLAGTIGSGAVIGRIDPTSLVVGTLGGAAGGGLGTFGHSGHGISIHTSAGGDVSGPTAGPDGAAPHVPDGLAPDATTVDLGHSGPTGVDGPTIDGPTPHGPTGADGQPTHTSLADGPTASSPHGATPADGSSTPHTSTTPHVTEAPHTSGAPHTSEAPHTSDAPDSSTASDAGAPADGPAVDPSASDGVTEPAGGTPAHDPAGDAPESADDPGVRPDTGDGPTHGVRFFGPEQLHHYLGPDAHLGRPEDKVFLMPEEDATRVYDSLSAAIESGWAPSVANAWRQGLDVFGVSVPLDGFTPRAPTIDDAGGYPHYVPGGHTAVRVGDEFFISPTRELVVDGGSPMPPGTVVFRLINGGAWEILAIFG